MTQQITWNEPRQEWDFPATFANTWYVLGTIQDAAGVQQLRLRNTGCDYETRTYWLAEYAATDVPQTLFDAVRRGRPTIVSITALANDDDDCPDPGALVLIDERVEAFDVL